jgi:hypothetical protein
MPSGARNEFGIRNSSTLCGSFMLAIAALLSCCAPPASTPMSGPIDVMVSPWGPFARQCDSTRVSYDTMYRSGRPGLFEVASVYKTCAGFVAMPLDGNAVQITASVDKIDQTSSPLVLRILRTPEGIARAAAPGDTGLLAQGSDAQDAARVLASEIGLTARQVIGPNDIVALPVPLSLPFPVDIELSCRPDGGHRDRDRDTLVLSCTFDQNVRTPRLDARVRLAGVEEIDIQTGIRLSSVLTGGLNGRIQLGDRNGAWHSADDRLLYRRNSHAARLCATEKYS